MSGIRFSVLKRFSSMMNTSPAMRGFTAPNNCARLPEIRPLSSFGRDRSFHSGTPLNFRALAEPRLLSSCFRTKSSLLSLAPQLTYHSYSSIPGSKNDSEDLQVPEASSASDGGSGILGGDWDGKLKEAGRSVVDAVTVTSEKAKESWDVMVPYVQQGLDSHPYLRDAVVPVAGTLTAASLAWLVMPRVFKRLHMYSQHRTARLLSGSLFGDEAVPYEKSVFGALEDPVRYLFTFMAFTQIATMLAPDEIASVYLSQAWKGATTVSLIWFLYRWKTSVFTRALAAHSTHSFDRDTLLTLDKVTSVGLLFVGLMALSEACGVAFQSILTVGGIGGVATAFAAKDILGNVLSGLSMQFSRPFSLGDMIKAGPVEGQVTEMGLTTTSLLNAEKFPVIVPNSLFSSQFIVNKSRAKWRSTVRRIPLELDNLDTIPEISEDIKSMLKSHPKIFLGQEVPYCFLSRVESTYAELTLGCNLTKMSKDELYSTEQSILLQAIKIIKQHGAKLGSTWQDTNSP